MMPMNRLIIGIGSNVSDRDKRMEKALEWIQTAFDVVDTSGIYETPELHGRFAPYLNCVALLDTDIPSPDMVTQLLKNYELSQGRTPESKTSGEVPIDIDLIQFNDLVLRPHEFEREYFLSGYRHLIDSLHHK